MRVLALLAAAAIAAPAAAPAATGDCPRATLTVSTASLIHQLSANAEAVAPTGGKHRAVTHPSNVTLPVANYIDTWIAAKQARDHVLPTVIAGDEEFLRRVTLDLTGQIPTSAAVAAFVADTSPAKRAHKIDELLASDAFTDRWTMWFGDLVQNVQASTNVREFYVGRNAYYGWIRDSIRSGKPYDVLVRELVAGKGDSFLTGTPNYVVRQLQNNGPPQDTYDNLAAHSAEKFLGIPMLCISCHDGSGHLELVNWYLRGKKRYDFWRMAAFFARVTAKSSVYTDPANPNANLRKFDVEENPNGRYLLNTDSGNKTPRAPAAGATTNVVTPAFLLTGEEPKAGEAYRDAYGRMLTSNSQFARATVNYVWKEMFGLGLVEPVNAFDLTKLTTQPTHPELLQALADDFVAKNYDLRALLRTIANSSTYQLSAQYTPAAWQEAWVPDYARRYPQRMSAEALLDAIATATALPPDINVSGLPTVHRAMQLPDTTESRRTANGRFLDAFGRGDRDENKRTSDSSISQALALLNDPIVTTRVRRASKGSTVATVLALTNDPGTIADRLYLATLSRKPTTTERQLAIDYLRSGTLGDRAEDLQFALINSLEFSFN